MSKTQLQVLSTDQAARVDRIKAYHAGCLQAFGDQMGYAFLTGRELIAAKASIPSGHKDPEGGFGKWIKANVPELSNGTIHRYMSFATALEKQFPTVGNISPTLLQIGPGGLDESAKAEVLKAVHEVADGKTLTELYRDLGVIRGPKDKKHHAPKLNAAETAEAQIEQAKQFVQTLIGDMALVQQGTTLADVPSQLCHELNRARIELGHFIKRLQKSRRKQGKSNKETK
jgi:hypothetical protein